MFIFKVKFCLFYYFIVYYLFYCLLFYFIVYYLKGALRGIVISLFILSIYFIVYHLKGAQGLKGRTLPDIYT